MAISPQVLAAGQAFWSPYNQGLAPCVSLLITYIDNPVLDTGADVNNGEAQIGYPVEAFRGQPVRQPCHLRLSKRLHRQPRAYQCAVVAHEIGHAGMGLPHSEDPRNIMYASQIVPQFCRDAFPRAHACVGAEVDALSCIARPSTGSGRRAHSGVVGRTRCDNGEEGRELARDGW